MLYTASELNLPPPQLKVLWLEATHLYKIFFLFFSSCSICVMKQNWHFIVPDKDFKLIKVYTRKYYEVLDLRGASLGEQNTAGFIFSWHMDRACSISVYQPGYSHTDMG